MTTHDIAKVTTDVFQLLTPLEPEERRRVVSAVFALLGDQLPPGVASGGPHSPAPGFSGGDAHPLGLGPKAGNWAKKHSIGTEKLEHAFYFHDDKVDLIVNTIPGTSRREQTINCYLLVGLRSFLESDSAALSDSDAIALCKHTQCYDKNNHTTFRKALGNLVSGSKNDGFELTGPGLKAGAALISELQQTNA